jgi:hypothetical protein
LHRRPVLPAPAMPRLCARPHEKSLIRPETF